uniref:Uncharacterized protein n=1 Tax=Acrobeloides nanus TaxID=290746 RepID=A0A914E5D1_9BILA
MISPIVLVMLPLVYVVGSMALGISDVKLSIVLNMGFAWMPMLNCITTTFFVRPYRVAVEQLLCGRCCKISNKWTTESTTQFVRVQPTKTLVVSVTIIKNPK